jgi:hypothetical protein
VSDHRFISNDFNSSFFINTQQALYETKSIYSGGCPTCYCGLVPNKEPFWSRLAWTWLGVSVGSIFFFIAATYLYQVINQLANETYHFACFSHNAVLTARVAPTPLFSSASILLCILRHIMDLSVLQHIPIRLNRWYG